MAVEILERWAPVLSGVELRSGTRGVFEVSVDGTLVFDRAETRRLPEPREVPGLLEPVLGPPLQWRRSRG